MSFSTETNSKYNVSREYAYNIKTNLQTASNYNEDDFDFIIPGKNRQAELTYVTTEEECKLKTESLLQYLEMIPIIFFGITASSFKEQFRICLTETVNTLLYISNHYKVFTIN